MDGQERQPSDADAIRARLAAIGSTGLSRRDFTRRVGAGSAAVVGIAFAAPKITTIRYASKVAAGSGPPTTSTSTSSSIPEGPQATVTLLTITPCAGKKIHLQAGGFAPKTAVTIEIDSAAHTIGVATADSAGNIDVQVSLPEHGLTGSHSLRVSGIAPGGKTVSATTGITIHSEDVCEQQQTTTTRKRQHEEGSTAGTTETTTGTTVGPTTVTTAPAPPSVGGGLAFTGTDAIDLALIGGAAAIGGRALYGLARRTDETDEEDE